MLGCARPKCHGWGNVTIGEPAQFYRIHGKEDGYMRKAEPGMNRAAFGDKAEVSVRFSVPRVVGR